MKKNTNLTKKTKSYGKFLFFRINQIKRIKNYYKNQLLMIKYIKNTYGLLKSKKINQKSKKATGLVPSNNNFSEFLINLENNLNRILIKVNFFSNFKVLQQFLNCGCILVNNTKIYSKNFIVKKNDIITIKSFLSNYIKKVFNLKSNLLYKYQMIYNLFYNYKKNPNLHLQKLVYNKKLHSDLLVNYKYHIIIKKTFSNTIKIKNAIQKGEFNDFYLNLK